MISNSYVNAKDVYVSCTNIRETSQSNIKEIISTEEFVINLKKRNYIG